MILQFGGILKPFDEMCLLKGNLEADGYLEYNGLNNVNMDLRMYMCYHYIIFMVGVSGKILHVHENQTSPTHCIIHVYT